MKGGWPRSGFQVGKLAPAVLPGFSVPNFLSMNFTHFAFFASNDSIDSMATLTIRQLDEKTKTRLRVRAAYHGRSMEEEAREILRFALTTASPVKGNLAVTIHRRFAALGGIELELPRRDPIREIPDLANDHPRH